MLISPRCFDHHLDTQLREHGTSRKFLIAAGELAPPNNTGRGTPALWKIVNNVAASHNTDERKRRWLKTKVIELVGIWPHNTQPHPAGACLSPAGVAARAQIRLERVERFLEHRYELALPALTHLVTLCGRAGYGICYDRLLHDWQQLAKRFTPMRSGSTIATDIERQWLSEYTEQEEGT